MRAIGKTIKTSNLHAILTSDRVYVAVKRKGHEWSGITLDFKQNKKQWATRAELKGVRAEEWVERAASHDYRRRRRDLDTVYI
jgi:hypothetical protein